MANWGQIGIGLSSGLQGFGQGQALVKNVRDRVQDNKLRGIREQGMETAKSTREADIGSRVKANEAGGFEVGGKSYADEASARKAASTDVDDLLEYYRRDTVPQLREAYMADGDVEKADAFERWNADKEVQAGQKHWARGMKDYAAGNMKGAASAFLKAWNVPGYGMGGVKDARAIEKDGKTTGFEFDIDDGKGGVRTEKLEGDQLIRQGLATLAPNQMFELLYKEQAAADAARAKTLTEARANGLKFQQDVALEDRRQQGRAALADRNAALDMNKLGAQQNNAVELETLKSQLKAAETKNGADSPLMRDYTAMVSILEQSGMDPEQARTEAANRKLYRLSQSPQDRVRDTMSDLAKTDLSFSRLTMPEQIKRVQEVMAAEDQLVGAMPGGGGAAGAAPAAAAPAGAKQTGTPYYDTKTGQTIYR